MNYRIFDIHEEDFEKLMNLRSKVYHKEIIDREFWEWKYFKCPLAKNIKVFVAEHDNEIIGSTSRYPIDLCVENEIHRVYFNVDSMVHPQYRGKGIISELYVLSSKILPLMISKGTTLKMYSVLMKMGFTAITPNTYLTKYLSYPKILINKTGVIKLKGKPPDTIIHPAFQKADRFDAKFDNLVGRTTKHFDIISVKTAKYMNWRYINHPRIRYHVFCRKIDGKLITYFVIRFLKNQTAYIVDLLWDPEHPDEPVGSLNLLLKTLKKSGYSVVKCWLTNRYLREILAGIGFVDKGETPHLSALGPADIMDLFLKSKSVHLVDGDSDYDAAFVE